MTKILSAIFVLFLTASVVCAEEALPITEKQLAEITRTLRNVLDENRKLAEGNEATIARLKDLEDQFQNVQQQSSGNSEDIEAVKKEQAGLKEENERLKNAIRDFKARLDEALDQPERAAASFSDQDYSDMNLPEKSALAVQKSTQVREDGADVYYQMAEEAFLDGHYEESLEYYQKTLQLNPDASLTDHINRQVESIEGILAN